MEGVLPALLLSFPPSRSFGPSHSLLSPLLIAAHVRSPLPFRGLWAISPFPPSSQRSYTPSNNPLHTIQQPTSHNIIIHVYFTHPWVKSGVLSFILPQKATETRPLVSRKVHTQAIVLNPSGQSSHLPILPSHDRFCFRPQAELIDALCDVIPGGPPPQASTLILRASMYPSRRRFHFSSPLTLGPSHLVVLHVMSSPQAVAAT